MSDANQGQQAGFPVPATSVKGQITPTSIGPADPFTSLVPIVASGSVTITGGLFSGTQNFEFTTSVPQNAAKGYHVGQSYSFTYKSK